jgi:hypothetical protein
MDTTPYPTYARSINITGAVLRSNNLQVGAVGSAIPTTRKTKQVIRETLDIKRQIDARDLELDRLTRDVAASERKITNYTSAIGDADDAGIRGHLMAVLTDERRHLADLKDALARVQAHHAPADAKTILERLEARVDELRAGLAKGGLAALPTVSNLLGEDRLDATRREDGKWDLNGKGYPIRVFYAPSEFVKVGPSQKNLGQRWTASPRPIRPSAEGASPR